MAEKRRAARVVERVREEVARSLAREIRDPRVVGVVVTRVEMPDDLQLATIYVRLEQGGDDPAARKLAMKGLASTTPKLRRSVGARLGMRYAPELRFHYDEGVDAKTRVEELLHEIKSEKGED